MAKWLYVQFAQMHFDSSTEERELDKFAGPGAITGTTNEGMSGCCFVHNETMIAILVNLAICRICSQSKPWPGRKDRQGREGEGREGKRQAPFARF